MNHSKKSYVTLIEVMLAAAVVAILAAIIIPFFGKASQKGKYTQWNSQKNRFLSQPGLISYFDFMDKQGQILGNSAKGMGKEDYDAAIFDGRLRNGAKWQQGRWQMKGAVAFNGSSSYISATADLSEDAFSALMWFKTDSKQGGLFSTSESKALQSQSDRSIYLNQGRIVSYMNKKLLESKTQCNDGQWHLLAITIGPKFNKHKLYIDGELEIENELINFGSKLQKSYFIGFSKRVGYFRGAIDEALFFNREITPEEISEAYKNGQP